MIRCVLKAFSQNNMILKQIGKQLSIADEVEDCYINMWHDMMEVLKCIRLDCFRSCEITL